jgi:PhoPQ-activated pathogenicity-related protein
MGELDAYLDNGDASFVFSARNDRIELISQTWRGIPWKHAITVSGDVRAASCVVLVLTGGDPNDADEAEASWLNALSRQPVATLYNLPNQPLFDDLWEDDLIAFTFIQYLATGESDWPLLFPMAKAAIRAMDAIEATFGKPLRFVITGLSKRGWTTWLAAATGDARIVGIAPMVIDHLNIPAQMEHQLHTWGEYSEQIKAYTDLDLPKELDSEEGLELNRLVDPYAYKDRFSTPILIVVGANDRYWQVDAMRHYWGDLPDPKWVRVVPNVEHILGDKMDKNHALAAFARHIAEGVSLMSHRWEWQQTGSHLCMRVMPQDGFVRSRMWAAGSQDYEFRDKNWQVLAEGYDHLSAALPAMQRAAVFGEMAYRFDDLKYSVTTPITVLSPLQR